MSSSSSAASSAAALKRAAEADRLRQLVSEKKAALERAKERQKAKKKPTKQTSANVKANKHQAESVSELENNTNAEETIEVKLDSAAVSKPSAEEQFIEKPISEIPSRIEEIEIEVKEQEQERESEPEKIDAAEEPSTEQKPESEPEFTVAFSSSSPPVESESVTEPATIAASAELSSSPSSSAIGHRNTIEEIQNSENSQNDNLEIHTETQTATEAEAETAAETTEPATEADAAADGESEAEFNEPSPQNRESLTIIPIQSNDILDNHLNRNSNPPSFTNPALATHTINRSHHETETNSDSPECLAATIFADSRTIPIHKSNSVDPTESAAADDSFESLTFAVERANELESELIRQQEKIARLKANRGLINRPDSASDSQSRSHHYSQPPLPNPPPVKISYKIDKEEKSIQQISINFQNQQVFGDEAIKFNKQAAKENKFSNESDKEQIPIVSSSKKIPTQQRPSISQPPLPPLPPPATATAKAAPSPTPAFRHSRPITPSLSPSRSHSSRSPSASHSSGRDSPRSSNGESAINQPDLIPIDSESPRSPMAENPVSRPVIERELDSSAASINPAASPIATEFPSFSSPGFPAANKFNVEIPLPSAFVDSPIAAAASPISESDADSNSPTPSHSLHSDDSNRNRQLLSVSTEFLEIPPAIDEIEFERKFDSPTEQFDEFESNTRSRKQQAMEQQNEFVDGEEYEARRRKEFDDHKSATDDEVSLISTQPVVSSLSSERIRRRFESLRSQRLAALADQRDAREKKKTENLMENMKNQNQAAARAVSQQHQQQQHQLQDRHSAAAGISPVKQPRSTKSGHSNESNIAVSQQKRSNRQLLSNAISFVCLAGSAPSIALMRAEALEHLKAAPIEHFLILLGHSRALAYRGLYWLNIASQTAVKLCGDSNAPTSIHADHVAEFFKYDSAAKKFSPIPALEHFSPTTDAFVVAKKVKAAKQ